MNRLHRYMRKSTTVIKFLAFIICRIEAARCPDVVVAQIDPKKLKRKQSVNVSVSFINHLGISHPHALKLKTKYPAASSCSSQQC